MKRHAWDAAEVPGKKITFLAASLLICTGAAAQTSDLVSQTALRVCQDPANMPFSNEAAQGFENRIAELLAHDLNLPLEYTWFPQVMGFVRNTLGAKKCDVVIGYAAGSDAVQNSNPYYKSAWAFVYRKGGDLDGVETLTDARLKDRRLGIVAGAPPTTILAENGLIGRAKSYALAVDRRYKSPAEGMIHDIATGEIEGGVLWGPIGGYFAKSSPVPLVVVPLVKEREGPPMTYRISFALRHGENNWKHRLNDFITAHQKEIWKILQGYGVPLLDDQDHLIASQ